MAVVAAARNNCTCSYSSIEERDDKNVDAEVAEVLREILARANQNMEYGSLIWVDNNGFLQHTSLIPTSTERAAINVDDLPRMTDGTNRHDFSRVVAMVHSHPKHLDVTGRDLVDPLKPEYLLYPWSGDWESFDSYADLIRSAGGNASRFEQYIIGYDPISKSLLINEYDASDRGTNTVASGDPVDPNEQGCTC